MPRIRKTITIDQENYDYVKNIAGKKHGNTFSDHVNILMKIAILVLKEDDESN